MIKQDNFFKMTGLINLTEISDLISNAKQKNIAFVDVLAFIEDNYQFTPVSFTNGTQHNNADENQGSAKVFGFAKLHDLSAEDTLSLFVEHYQSVLDTPDENNHSNIRNFINTGWEGLVMEINPLIDKN